MVRALSLACVLLAALSGPAAAACYADYKAKRDNPLRLHYGVVELSEAACRDRARAEREVRARVEGGGWQLLNVVSVFDASGLDERRESAGAYFLRF